MGDERVENTRKMTFHIYDNLSLVNKAYIRDELFELQNENLQLSHMEDYIERVGRYYSRGVIITTNHPNVILAIII